MDWKPNIKPDKGQLVRFQSGNVYRYDPDAPEAKDENPANMPKPWALEFLVDQNRTHARRVGDRVH